MFGKKLPPQDFWKWFVSHEEELFHFEKNLEKTFDRLHSKLCQVDPDLSFEIGPDTEEGRDFVVSASGMKSAFPSVTALVGAAPKLSRWRVIGFRPRRDFLPEIELRGRMIDAREVQFSLTDEGREIGMFLFIPGYDDEDFTWKEIGYLLLDLSLGEFDVETKLGPLKFVPPDAPVRGPRFPLAELPQLFDKHFIQMRLRAGNPLQGQDAN